MSTRRASTSAGSTTTPALSPQLLSLDSTETKLPANQPRSQNDSKNLSLLSDGEFNSNIHNLGNVSKASVESTDALPIPIAATSATTITETVKPVSESFDSKNPPVKLQPAKKQLPHYRPIHINAQDSIFSRENIYSLGTTQYKSKSKPEVSRPSSGESPTRYFGFRNLAMIVLIVGNIRLLVENYIKYGLLASFERMSGIPDHDIKIALLLTAFIPGHLFVSLVVERVAASWALTPQAARQDSQVLLPKEATTEDKPIENSRKKSFATRPSSTSSSIAGKIKMKHLWRLFAALHAINALLCLVITSYTVYTNIWHPVVGTICEIHAVVLCLKVASYALTNRDLRDATIIERANKKTGNENDNDIPEVPELYSSQPYPTNLTIGNLVYFWWAPTLVYQPVYPRTPRVRWRFVARHIAELIVLVVVMWFIVRQYAVPILENSLQRMATERQGNNNKLQTSTLQNLVLMGERLMKLATVSILVWLLGFFALFQSFLNLLAELTRFADRDFYQDWWNSGSLGTYWKLWNRPVSNYFRRHLYIPMLKRGFSTFQSSLSVFFVSAVLHEVMVGIPTHNVLGFAFFSMMLQVPLILVTAPLERMRGPGSTIGNMVFWLAFFLGQPLGVLVYYYAWNVKYNPGALKVTNSTEHCNCL